MTWSLHDGSGQRKYLTDTERRRFWEAASQREADVFSFCWTLLETGCRLSEALELTTDRIDHTAGLLVFESLKKRRSGVYRAVPISRVLLEQIERTDTQRIGELEASSKIWPWARMTGHRRVKEVMAAAQIVGPFATAKGLRHGFGVAALQRGVPINTLQKWMGHASIATTAIYGNAVGQEERNLARATWISNKSA